MADRPLALLTSDDEQSRIGAHYLAERFASLTVIVEQPVSRAALLRRRLHRLGAVTVTGQLAFMVVQRAQASRSRVRIEAIKRQHGLVDEWPPDRPIRRVPSVNAPECVALLEEIAPAAVLVMGTRLIEASVLANIGVPFINYHAGITPKYRGVHGGYWALAEGDKAACGVTVHLVDAGIDTGAVLYQHNISPEQADGFSTYPYLQLAVALPLMAQAARDALAGTLAPHRVDLPSRLWSHPTLWRYVATGLRRGVW